MDEDELPESSEVSVLSASHFHYPSMHLISCYKCQSTHQEESEEDLDDEEGGVSQVIVSQPLRLSTLGNIKVVPKSRVQITSLRERLQKVTDTQTPPPHTYCRHPSGVSGRVGCIEACLLCACRASSTKRSPNQRWHRSSLRVIEGRTPQAWWWFSRERR